MTVGNFDMNKNAGWFRDARFGMFIHWGIYSILGKGEWALYYEDIPYEEYERMQSAFNPSSFSAEEWADVAWKAGMRYLVFTTKHHDGFCMYDSALTEQKVCVSVSIIALSTGGIRTLCQTQNTRYGKEDNVNSQDAIWESTENTFMVRSPNS